MSSEANTQAKNQGKRNRQRNRNQNKRANADLTSTPANTDTVPNAEASLAEPQTTTENGEVVIEDGQSIADEDASVCLICAEPVKYYSVSECNHRTCHVCALRLRALYKKFDCTLCKEPQKTVVFTTSSDALFSEYNLESMPFKDAKLSISFETQEMMEETMILLRFNCPDSDCTFIARNWNDLKAHVRAAHGKLMCELCIRFKKVFAHEHTLYSPNQLPIHLPSMTYRQSKQGQVEKVEGGIHPLCEFCRECFFGDDELYAHMRDRHEECFICKRQGIRDQYFLDYNSLERHFSDSHYPCSNSTCREQKFVVFGSTMDLKAHMVEQHGTTMSARDLKDARRVVADFDFEESATTNRRRRDRVRIQEEQPPQNQAPNGNRDRRREGFGAALTNDDASGSGANTPAPRVSGHPSPSPSREPVDPAVAQRHTAFLSRISALASNSNLAVTAVKAAIRSYRNSESAARDLIVTFYNIFDNNLDTTGTLITPLVDLLDDEDKRKELLEAWHGFRIEHRQDFPNLIPGGPESAYSGVASGRVLNAKHSTATRSSRQALDRVARAASSSNSFVPGAPGPSLRTERFPALPVKMSSSTMPTPAHRQPQRMTPWASSSSAAPPVQAPRSEAAPKVGRGSNAIPSLSSTSFPSLPTAAARSKLPMSGNKSMRNVLGNSTPSANAWSSSGNAANESEDAQGVEESATTAPDNSNVKGKKKKGKEKITLFTLGSFPT